ncbi:DUF5107 domain-containing protein [Streptomyces sp. NPDC004610]|uniref:DUF5107 domain-containing protein n=1 Tax=unclassified Streptomyces TaxID=2593676 RepID=UPI0033AB1159
MSELRLSTLVMPTAETGPTNPLPPLFTGRDTHAVADLATADDEMRRNIAYGRLPSVLPYTLQDGYRRTREPREHQVAVLENDLLRATFLPHTGGRLWSLIHKPTNRELLFRNPVFQPANLALRNAWVAGGVEWNIGTIGHTPTTCSPLHTVRAGRPDGTPVLRMYEFERLRRVVFQIDASLPDGSGVLLVHIRIINPNSHTVPIYWWSNIAVPEAPDVRVLAPADSAWHFAYDQVLRHVPVPEHEGLDRTRTTRARAAADYFFDLAPEQRRWITALDGRGQGLAQTSTDRLRGRKLFLWGRHPGGRRWQEWLSGPDTSYLEIQAGLARTQLEHEPLPAGGEWTWAEAYGLLSADASAVHGDWPRARAAAEAGLDSLITRDALEADLKAAAAWIDSPPLEVLSDGSGWGALERRRRSAQGDHSLSFPATPFTDRTLGPEQEPWLTLLTTGTMPTASPATAPASYEADPAWAPLLEDAGDWLGLLHQGVLHAARGDLAAAESAWSRSVAAEPNAWAHRNLAVLADRRGETETAVHSYLRAHELTPELTPLIHELLELLLRDDQPSLALSVVDALGPEQRADGRTRLLEARAALAADRLDRCGPLLEEGIEVPTLREGETSLGDLWREYQKRRAQTQGSGAGRAQGGGGPMPEIPQAYDFTLHPGAD